MAQRTTMRVSLAQLMAMRDNARQSSQAPVAPAVEPTDTIYYVTAHITVVNNGGFVYHVAFGPNRSRSTTMEALTHIFPRVESFFEGLPGPVPMDDRNNHFRWTENNGDEVLVRIEHNKNPTVCASGPGQEHFGVIHRVTDYNFSPISERADIVGTSKKVPVFSTPPARFPLTHANFEIPKSTFTTNSEAGATALRLFRSDIEGHAVEGVAEVVKEDGTLRCAAQSSGEGGYRWTVEVNRATWQASVH